LDLTIARIMPSYHPSFEFHLTENRNDDCVSTVVIAKRDAVSVHMPDMTTPMIAHAAR